MLAAAIALIQLTLIWLAGAVAVPLLIAGLIAATFVAAGMHAAPRPAGTGLDIAGRLKLWVGEITAAWSVLLCAMPFERWLMRRDCPAHSDTMMRGGGPGIAPSATPGAATPGAAPGTDRSAPPVLLIHGYVNNAGALWRLWRDLCRKGLGVYTLNLEPVYADIDRYALRIAARIDAICASTGAAEVTLVCHSMGGLAARAYLRHCALTGRPPRVAKIITLGSPHHGTRMAGLEGSPNGRQMRINSAWLGGLAAHERGAWACPVVSIYSQDDNIVVPSGSARLDGARNIELAGIGHISLPLARRVIDLVGAEV